MSKFMNAEASTKFGTAAKSYLTKTLAAETAKAKLSDEIVAVMTDAGVEQVKDGKANPRKTTIGEIQLEMVSAFCAAAKCSDVRDDDGKFKGKANTFYCKLNGLLGSLGYRQRASKKKSVPEGGEGGEGGEGTDTTPTDPRAAVTELAGQIMKKAQKGDIDSAEVLKILVSAGLEEDAVILFAETLFDKQTAAAA